MWAAVGMGAGEGQGWVSPSELSLRAQRELWSGHILPRCIGARGGEQGSAED